MADIPTVAPHGLAMAQLVSSIVFGILSTILVFLRCLVRFRHEVFGLDDGLMVAGYYVWFFQIFYCAALVFIKASICATLLRIAVMPTHRAIAWATLGMAICSALIVFISLFVLCQPLPATWTGEGTCASPAALAILSYFVSASSLVTDLVCAVLPGFMLYKTQMKLATRISVTIVLGVGAIASVATIIRMPYLKFYFNPTEDYLYRVCDVALWCIFETGIGIVAGCLPPLRMLVKRWVNFDAAHGNSSGPKSYGSSNALGVTSNIGTAGRSQRFGKSQNATNDPPDGNWERLDDSSSKQRIYVTTDMEMTTMAKGEVAEGSHDSTEELTRPA